MNGRVFLAGALGGLALFIWLSISWAALPFHMESLHGIKHNAQLDALLIQMGAQQGLNYYPSQEGHSAAEHKQLTRSVPGIGIMTFAPEGISMSSPMPFILGLIGCIIAGLLVAQFLAVMPATASMSGKILFCTMFGVAAFFCTHWVNGGFFHFPMRHLMLDLFDGIVGWSLAGIVMAIVLRQVAAAPDATR
jgi:hypothetical protein